MTDTKPKKRKVTTGPLSEEECMLALPGAGWVRDYCNYAVRQTTSPIGYHLLTGLITLGMTCPMNLCDNYAGELYPNLFGLVVGRSGEDQKSTALNIGYRLLYRACADVLGPQPGSAEGLIDALEAQPKMLITYKEMGKFLSMAKGTYLEAVKTVLTDLWDCAPQQRAKAGGNIVRCDDPRLSAIGACAIPYLESYTQPQDWTGGFLGRWTVMYCIRERIDPDPIGDPTGRDDLIEGLRERVNRKSAPPCWGLNGEAKEMWTEWFLDLYHNREYPDLIAGIKSRAPSMARKIALIYAWDFALEAGDESGFYICKDVLGPALKFVDLHLKSVGALAVDLARHTDAHLRKDVLRVFQKTGVHVSLGKVLEETHHRQRIVEEILEGLVTEKRLKRFKSSNGDVIFKRVY